MRYTLLLYSDRSQFRDQTEEDVAQSRAVFGKYIADLQKAGVLVDTDWLAPTDAATTLSLQGGERVVHDGPFAATKEQLGGYFVVDVSDLDAALAWAEKCPAAHYGKVEIRASMMPSS